MFVSDSDAVVGASPGYLSSMLLRPRRSLPAQIVRPCTWVSCCCCCSMIFLFKCGRILEPNQGFYKCSCSFAKCPKFFHKIVFIHDSSPISSSLHKESSLHVGIMQNKEQLRLLASTAVVL